MLHILGILQFQQAAARFQLKERCRKRSATLKNTKSNLNVHTVCFPFGGTGELWGWGLRPGYVTGKSSDPKLVKKYRPLELFSLGSVRAPLSKDKLRCSNVVLTHGNVSSTFVLVGNVLRFVRIDKYWIINSMGSECNIMSDIELFQSNLRRMDS